MIMGQPYMADTLNLQKLSQQIIYGQGEPTPLLPHLDGSLLHFLIPLVSILEGGRPCERSLRGAFFKVMAFHLVTTKCEAWAYSTC